MSEPLELARDAIRRVHKAAVRHRDDSLHHAAREITASARAMGYELGPVEEYRPCPACDAEPGEACITMPGHRLVDGIHPERTRSEGG
ncbi:zinc finger domain-containing protein [Micromonospora globispora]|uniref:zinc finger domain-containing protein n=1 Tax=Micromonospora globispora TaxID=1450148 RepID=UPI003C6CD9EB